MVKEISEEQSEKIFNFLSSLNITKLKDKYEKPYTEDGDRKRIKIWFKNKIKRIEINNVYQKDMVNLYDVINQVIGIEYRIIFKTN